MKAFLLLLFVSILLSSCGTYIAPAYTSMDKMLQIENGMNREKVDETLGVKPYDIILKNDSISIFEYNYRLEEREIKNLKPAYTDESQTGGKPWFTKPSKVYFVYKHDKFSGLITDKGLRNFDSLFLMGNNKLFFEDIPDTITTLEKEPCPDDNEKPIRVTVDSDFKHHVLYSAYLPNGEIGFKYAFGRKIGVYASGAYSVDWQKISYVTFGMLLRASNKVDVYAGLGAGPDFWYSNYYGGYDFALNSPAFEAGTLLCFNKLTIDTGLGYSLYEGIYLKLGVGVNF